MDRRRMRFRKKPVEIDAVQFKGEITDEIRALYAGRPIVNNNKAAIFIRTLDGAMEVNFNDWIIRDVRGDLYVCKPELFEATYEPSHVDASWACICPMCEHHTSARKASVVETIEAAAIRVDGVVYSVPRPGRHHNVFTVMPEHVAKASHIDDQGFVTSTGRFVGREEACLLARAANQLIREPTPSYMLTSEDVW